MIRLLSGPDFMTGTALLAFVTGVIVDEIEERVDQQHHATIDVEPSAAWLAKVRANQHIVYEFEGRVREWRIAGRKRGMVGRDRVVRLDLDPLHTWLTDQGPVVQVIEAGHERSNLGGVRNQVHVLFNTFLLPFLATRGIDRVAAGVIQTDEQVNITWEIESAAQLIDRIAQETETEWQLRRDEVERLYRIDFLRRIGEDAGEVWLSEGRNLADFRIDQAREGMATVTRPHGQMPDNGQHASTIAEASWLVTAVAGDVLTVRSHAHDAGPILEDGQFAADVDTGMPARYVLAPDGTLRQVVATDAPDKIEVADATGIAVGDDIGIAADDQGTALTELESPTGLRRFGRVVDALTTSFRGERNWASNPLMRRWPTTTPDDAYWGDASSTGTTPTISQLPVGLEIRVGDAVVGVQSINSDVTVGDTVDGSGEATPTLSPGLVAGGAVSIHRVPPMPDGWTRPTTSAGRAVVNARDLSVVGDIAGNADGAHSTARSVDLKSLPAGSIIQPGDWIEYGANRRNILGRVVVDGSGNARVAISGLATLSDNDAVTIRRPALGQTDAGATPLAGTALALPIQRVSSHAVAAMPVQTKPITIRHRPEMPRLRVEARYQIVLTTDRLGASVTLDPAGVRRPPSMRIMDVDTSTVLAEGWDEERTLAPGDIVDVSLRLDVELTATTRIAVRFAGAMTTEGDILGDPYTILRYITVYVSPDENVPPVEGSHATAMHLAGNEALALSRHWPSTYEGEIADIADTLGLKPEHPAMQVGGTVRARSRSLDVDERLRVMSRTTRRTLVKGETVRRTSVVMETMPQLLTTQVAHARPRPLYIELLIPGVIHKQVLAQPTPILLVPGAPRAVVPPGVTPPDATVPINPIPPGGLA